MDSFTSILWTFFTSCGMRRASPLRALISTHHYDFGLYRSTLPVRRGAFFYALCTAWQTVTRTQAQLAGCLPFGQHYFLCHHTRAGYTFNALLFSAGYNSLREQGSQMLLGDV